MKDFERIAGDLEAGLREGIADIGGGAARHFGPEDAVGLAVGGALLGALAWFYGPHVAAALEAGLVGAAPVLAPLAGTGAAAGAGQAAVRAMATRRTARARTTFLVEAAESPSREGLETVMHDLVSCRRRLLHWTDWRATGFRLIRTVSAEGMPICLWQLPEQFTPILMKAVGHVRGIRLVPLADVPARQRPAEGCGDHVARLELEPANNAYPFGEPPASAYRRWAWTFAQVGVSRGERLVEVTDFLPLAPGEVRRTRERVLRAAGRDLDHLRRDESPTAASIERQIAMRGLKAKQGDDTPRFAIQILARAGAPERDRAAQLLESIYSNWDQWAGAQNYLRARGRRVIGSTLVGSADAPIQRWWFDMRLDHGVIGGPRRIVTAREFAPLLHPWQSDELPPPPAVEGWHVCTTDDDRKMVLAPNDFAYNVHCIGSIGKGKTTSFERKVLDDINARRPVVYIDFKGDSIPRVLERVPEEHADGVRYADFTREDYSVGLNVLDCQTEDLRDVVVDHVLGCVARIFGDTWKYRQEEIARATLLTLMRHPGTTLPDMPLMLTNKEVRDRLTQNLRDPVLRMFWAWFETLSNGEREKVLGPLLAKLRFLLRRPVRRMLGQPNSRINLQELFDTGGALLLRLPRGQGDVTAPLLGALWVIQVWQAVMRRGPDPRHPLVSLVVDECQHVVRLIPATIAEMLAEGRGYRFSVWLAHQYLGQLSDEVRRAVEAVILTLIVYQLEVPADAHTLGARLRPLTDHDLLDLPRFRVAAKVCRDGRAGPPVMGAAPALPDGLGRDHAATIAARSLERWGRRTDAVDAEIERRLGGSIDLDDEGPHRKEGPLPWP